MFIIRSNQYNLRDNDFIIPRVHTTAYGEHSVRYLGPVFWSKIDRKFRELKMVDQFKRVIRKIDLAKHIVLTVLFGILNIVIILRFVVEIIEGIL